MRNSRTSSWCCFLIRRYCFRAGVDIQLNARSGVSPHSSGGREWEKGSKSSELVVLLPEALFFDPEALRNKTLFDVLDHAWVPAGVDVGVFRREAELIRIFLSDGVDTARLARPSGVLLFSWAG